MSVHVYINKSRRTRDVHATYANCRTLTPTFDSELTITSIALIFHGAIRYLKMHFFTGVLIYFATNLYKHISTS